ncbi:hypothetical protein DFJ74DRAFT_710003 [Hyaloraphidium curvatum]|nr:hypothetical protein DFJ74DRAFT_710003 [Hyaloraphidium curvatum]
MYLTESFLETHTFFLRQGLFVFLYYWMSLHVRIKANEFVKFGVIGMLGYMIGALVGLDILVHFVRIWNKDD